jgi:hypothetical protein
MLNKLFASILLAFVAISMAPAQAADIPVLTWEKGKEHNIVLGGNSGVKNWKIQLASTTGETLDFRQSKLDPKGLCGFLSPDPRFIRIRGLHSRNDGH